MGYNLWENATDVVGMKILCVNRCYEELFAATLKRIVTKINMPTSDGLKFQTRNQGLYFWTSQALDGLRFFTTTFPHLLYTGLGKKLSPEFLAISQQMLTTFKTNSANSFILLGGSAQVFIS